MKIIKDGFNFKNQKVLVMGLGLNGGGVGITKFLVKQGAIVTVTDLKPAEKLKESIEKLKNLKVKYVLGKHDEKDFKENEVIIKGAGIKWDNKYISIAIKNDKYVDTDVGIFFEFSKNFKIGITGSKGKSTTTSLIHHIINSYKKSKIAGNISVSFFENFDMDDKGTDYVLELSSWQLADLSKHKLSPDIAILTTIVPDHLNYYGSMEKYINDKKYIYKFQNHNNFFIFNLDNDWTNKFILKEILNYPQLKIIFFNGTNLQTSKLKEKLDNHQYAFFSIFFDKTNFYLAISEKNLSKLIEYFSNNIKNTEMLNFFNNNNSLILKEKELLIFKLFNFNNIYLSSLHNLYNVSGAISATLLRGIHPEKIKSAIESFKGVEFRNQVIGTFKKRTFVNDTTATIPDAVAVTLKSHKNIILIAGGMDKNLPLENMINTIIENVKYVVLLEGDGSEKLKDGLLKLGYNKIKYFYNNLEDAVNTAFELSSENDTILLSPGFASFNMFRNEFERGKIFNNIVKKYFKN